MTFNLNCAVPTILRWSDAGSGADQPFSCYGPDLELVDKFWTWFEIGHFGISARDGSKPKVYGVSVTQIENLNQKQIDDIFQRPTSFKVKWTDKYSGADKNGAFYRVGCPVGFGSLSDICMSYRTGDAPFPSVNFWCINEKYLEDDPRNVVIWNDKGSGALFDVQIHGGETNHTKALISVWGKTFKRIKPQLIQSTNC